MGHLESESARNAECNTPANEASLRTVGESFPAEIRARAISLFYAIGTAIGGVVGPWLFGVLMGTGERSAIALGYCVGAALMLIAAATESVIGISAERRALDDAASPLSADHAMHED